MTAPLKRAGAFVVDFIFGDDWTMAVVVVAGLMAAWGLVTSTFPAWIVPPIAVSGVLTVSVVRAVPRANEANTRTADPNTP